jgi:hypothetical protein
MARPHASTDPIHLARPDSPEGSGARRNRAGPCARSGPQKVPAKFGGSDVKVRAIECLCAGVNDRSPARDGRPCCRTGRLRSPGGITATFDPTKGMVPAPEPRLHVFTTPRRDGPSRAPGTSVVPTWRKRGVPSPSIEPTTADVQAIHRLAASGPQKATAPSPPATGPGTERRSATRPAPRSVTRAERAIRTAPNPGTSSRRRARSERRPKERSDGEQTGPRRRRGPR